MGCAYLRFSIYDLRFGMLAREARGVKAPDGPVQSAREAGGRGAFASLVVSEGVSMMNCLVRVARISGRRSPERVVIVLALRDETIVAHVIHAREQVAFDFVAGVEHLYLSFIRYFCCCNSHIILPIAFVSCMKETNNIEKRFLHKKLYNLRV